ncbi:hypothetical protein QPL79_02770 [Ignisphaera sp. 4213-co]|uniref:Uncharacterized protein n=1 Tax=Ignisphaera cupida TaxID=3050454 RepID=A0ABD4Z4N7_9CREN|nr:hypothetical protein [Ignisphaera sp. 4213-co]MDK6028286.1 hypothetical protein [Ignisphaera sp. 4213-co]
MITSNMLLIATLALLIAALLVSLNNYISFKRSSSGNDVNLLSVLMKSAHIKKGYAYTVDVGDSIVFVAVVKKRVSNSVTDDLAQEIKVETN